MVAVLWSYHGGRLVAVGGPIFKLEIIPEIVSFLKQMYNSHNT